MSLTNDIIEMVEELGDEQLVELGHCIKGEALKRAAKLEEQLNPLLTIINGGRDEITPLDAEMIKRHPMITLSRSQMIEMDKALADGKKVNAIKYVRNETGAGLKEAKAFVDDYEDIIQAPARVYTLGEPMGLEEELTAVTDNMVEYEDADGEY